MVSIPRSPNYPGIDLRVAVERAKLLYRKVQRGEFRVQDAAEAWGYKGGSSQVRRGMGALRQYGLIESKKGDNARLTNRAFTLALREPESREFMTALREAVESPSLFQEMIESGRANNAAGALRQYLVVEKRFTREGAETFIEVLKASMAFARVGDDDNMAWPDDDVIDGGEEVVKTATPASTTTPPPTAPISPPGSITIPIPLTGGGLATVTMPLDMSANDWKRLDTILSAYKPSSDELASHSTGMSGQSDDEPDTE